MLVLSRKTDQSVELPELGVVIRVMELKRSRVQLGIEAPRAIQVMRGEKVERREQTFPAVPAAALDSPAAAFDSPAAALDSPEELKRMELQLAALAELANSHDRQIARQVAGDAIDRLAAFRNRLTRGEHHQERHSASGPSQHARDRLAEPWSPEENETTICVRQSKASYGIESAA